MSQYYVYALCYPDGEPFYIGKGKGNRMNTHEKEVYNRKANNLQKAEIIQQIQANGQEVIKQKIAEFSDEQEAYMYEWALIYMTANSEHLTNCLNFRHTNYPKPFQYLTGKPDNMYTLSDLSRILGKHESALCRLIQKGEIKAQKIPPTRWGHWCIEREEIDKFLQSHKPKPKKRVSLPTFEKKEKRIMITEKIYSVKEAASLLDVVPTTILRRIREGKLKASQTNGSSGHYRIKEEDLIAFLDDETVNAQEQGA